MARHKGTNNSSLVESYLRKHAGIACDIDEMEMALGLTRTQVRNAIDYLRNGRQCPVQTVTRGKAWRWGSPVGLRRLAKRPKSGLRNPFDNVPEEKDAGNDGHEVTPKQFKEGVERMMRKLGSEDGAKLAAEVQAPDWGQEERAAPLHVQTVFAEERMQLAPMATDGERLFPTGERVVTLKVLGTLAETGEVLVQGSNEQGFESGVWAMRRLG